MATVPIDIFELQEETAESMLVGLKLSKDLREAAKVLSPKQQRIMVDLYYAIQENRKRAMSQVRMAQEEPNIWIDAMSAYLLKQEKLVAGALDISTSIRNLDLWCKSVHGIGPVITAGLAANIDMTKTPSISALWRFSGFDPTVKWTKGTKRPWNAQLKVLGWKIGESFCKFHNSPKCFYGHRYAARKLLEVARNDAGEFKDQAARALAERTIKSKEVKERYESGKLPDGRLELRARRKAVKLFLAHYWEVAYWEHYHALPKWPYVLAKDEALHRTYIPPQGYEDIFAVAPERR